MTKSTWNPMAEFRLEEGEREARKAAERAQKVEAKKAERQMRKAAKKAMAKEDTTNRHYSEKGGHFWRGQSAKNGAKARERFVRTGDPDGTLGKTGRS